MTRREKREKREKKERESKKRAVGLSDPDNIPGIGYYLLKPEDQILPGDELLQVGTDKWVTTSISGGNLTAGNIDKVIYRRPVTHVSIIGKFHRPLKVGEQIEQGDQFWDSKQQEWKNSAAIGMDYTSSTIEYRRPLKNKFNTMLNGYEVVSTPYMWGLLRAAGEDNVKIALLEEKMCVYYRYGKLTPTGNWRAARIIRTYHNGEEYETAVAVKFIEDWHTYFIKENSAGFMQLVFIEREKDQPVPTPPPIKLLSTTTSTPSTPLISTQ